MRKLCITVMLLLSACTTTPIDSSAISLRVELAGEVVNDKLIEVMSDEETLLVIESLELLDDVMSKWSSGKPDWPEMQKDYLSLRKSYLNVYAVTETHWHKYDKATQLKLLGIHTKFKVLDEKLSKNIGYAETAETILNTGLLLIKLLAKV